MNKRILVSTSCIVTILTSALSNGATLLPVYNDGSGEGFNDPTLGADRKSAFEFALSLWSNVLVDRYIGEVIEVEVQFDSLGGSASSATLGFAGPRGSGSVSGDPLGSNVFYPGALRNHLSGSDQVGGAEITATFNSDVDGNVILGTTTFYYGTDDNAPSGTTDFVSTALHEIGHGLGWSGTLRTVDGEFEGESAGEYLNDTLINSFDYFVQRTSDTTPLENLSAAERLTAATTDDISWSGAAGVAANGGTAPDLFGPDPAKPGSSYSHLDEGDFPTELMSPQATDGTGHTLSPLTLAILEDQGWATTTVPEPSGLLLLATSLLCWGRRKR